MQGTPKRPGRKKGATVNKAQEIRKVAREMIDGGDRPRPTKVVDILAAKGIEVSGPQVSMALRGTGMEYRSIKASDQTRNMKDFSAHDLHVVKQFLGDLGSIERAVKAIALYRKLLG